MKTIILSLLLLPLSSFSSAPASAASPASAAFDHENPSAVRAEIERLKASLSDLDTRMNELKDRYPARAGMPEVERELLDQWARMHDHESRRLSYRKLEASRLEKTQRSLASVKNARRPAAEKAMEHLNGTCPFVNDTLIRAAGLREGGVRWKENGRLDLKSSIPAITDNQSQNFVLVGDGFAFGRGNKKVRTHVRLEFGEEGKLAKLKIEQDSAGAKWSQHMTYDWKGPQCEVERVSVSSPELGGKEGVSYDREICRALDSKGLLDQAKIDECTDFSDGIGNTIEKVSRNWSPSKTFALFTTDPGGRTRLQPWTRKAHLSVNASIARDCVFNLRSGAPSASPEISEREGERSTTNTAQ